MNERLRAYVAERAGYACEYCLLPDRLFTGAFHVEHVIPRVHGGTDEPNNLAYACSRCNENKSVNLSGIDAMTGQVAVLYNPRNQKWSEHFHIEFAAIAGLTETGRATVIVLRMNDEPRIKLRAEVAARFRS